MKKKVYSHKKEKIEIEEIYLFIDDHLPIRYSSIIEKNLKEKEIIVTANQISNVRNRRATNLDILNALLELAKSSKEKKQKLILN